MKVPIGEMRDRAFILTAVRDTDASGGELITYTPGDCALFVSVRSLSTTESVQFGQVAADVTHVLFGHWTELNQVGGTDRIRLEESGQEFDINGGPINDPKRSFTRLNLIARNA